MADMYIGIAIGQIDGMSDQLTVGSTSTASMDVEVRIKNGTTAGGPQIIEINKALERLVDIFRSAAQGLGTEKRILLLHGPVGSAKSTIVRLLKKGLEHYSRTDAGALYSFAWKNDRHGE